jgi:MbtH protein
MTEDLEDDRTYEVVVNDEEQYSIWAADLAVPVGWRTVGVRGPKADCLAHIEAVWTDMRPRSLREAMDAAVPQDAAADTAPPGA